MDHIITGSTTEWTWRDLRIGAASRVSAPFFFEALWNLIRDSSLLLDALASLVDVSSSPCSQRDVASLHGCGNVAAPFSAPFLIWMMARWLPCCWTGPVIDFSVCIVGGWNPCQRRILIHSFVRIFCDVRIRSGDLDWELRM